MTSMWTKTKYWHRQLSRYILLHLSGSTLSTIIEQELYCLALAVVQAGAYISRFECGLCRYLEMYWERHGELLEEYRKQVQKIDDYKWTVYTMWLMSSEQLAPQAATFARFYTMKAFPKQFFRMLPATLQITYLIFLQQTKSQIVSAH